jgi:hypothetical protein
VAEIPFTTIRLKRAGSATLTTFTTIYYRKQADFSGLSDRLPKVVIGKDDEIIKAHYAISVKSCFLPKMAESNSNR